MRRVLAAAALLAGAAAFADFDGSYVVPLDHEAIQYATLPLNDRISLLQKEIREGKVKLAFEGRSGYLRSVLKALDIPVSSQVLVFSKTSFQAPRISPRTARAIYFNEHVSVGWVPGGDMLEIASVDPRQGVVFYTIDQEPTPRPRVDRRDDCLQCHASGGTVGVPGLMVRSIYPERTGMPIFRAGGFVTDHRSPLAERWGGWYVTGTHGSMRHMGNVFVEDRDQPDKLDKEKGANVTSLKDLIDTHDYLSPHSDIVALMVLEHQTRMTNLITRVGYETRMAMHYQKALSQALGEPEGELSDSTRRRIDNAAETLVKSMLLTDESLLDAPVKGTSSFAADFAARGRRDKKGRSLRDLDLTRRMFRYPCSFFIDEPSFAALPEIVRLRVYRRLWEVLTGKDQSPAFARVTPADRAAILEILRDTHSALPGYWRP